LNGNETVGLKWF